jgi:hypothetical protein
MFWEWLRRAARLVAPASGQSTVMLGIRPGYVWEPARSRWVDEEETWKPGVAFYTLVGPVYVPVGLHP